MFRNKLSYKFSVFMGIFCVLGIFAFFGIQEIANADIQALTLLILAGIILKSDLILAILVIIDILRKNKANQNKEINIPFLILEIISIAIYLLISAFLIWMVTSIGLYKP